MSACFIRSITDEENRGFESEQDLNDHITF